ncbi:pantoate--beta-alanine ligase [Aristophania vespae]|uniref:pantoate--beta-alanine ligase n=1 Tax=Aristophania vespae TaxID=2697033 RepID=UPI002351C14A|nr:pantoate--beta-alanine ligase [Aristophania vespae]UMM64514.1 Pantothenate synthetase [Aristophania vespae]
MEQCITIESLRHARNTLGNVGFVPTMGFLHEGHLSLVRRAKAENDAVIVSIFVNPAQFGPGEDFETYPRSLEQDVALLAKEGVDIVFTPKAGDIYPQNYVTEVSVKGVATQLEGASRPGHFTGVATIVTKLFNIVQPQKAYFGQKDAQQCAVIKRFVADLNIPVTIITVPTWREKDGLASSSRNVRLNPEERAKAPALYKALQRAQSLFQKGERDRNVLEKAIRDTLKQNNIEKIDYAKIVDPLTFQEVNPVSESGIALLAVPFSQARLIDNLPLALE